MTPAEAQFRQLEFAPHRFVAASNAGVSSLLAELSTRDFIKPKHPHTRGLDVLGIGISS